MSDVAELPAGDGRAERIEALRRRMAAIPARSETVLTPAEDSSLRRTLPVPDGVADLLPSRGLARGTVASVSGSASLLLGLVASVTAEGGYAALVGQRRLGLLAAVEMGAQLRRIAVVADPGPDPVEIASVLLDGMDLVILGLGGMAVPPSRSRVVAARVRNKGAVLVVTDGKWDGAHVRLDAQVRGYHGLTGPGRGRLCGTALSVRAQGRAFAARTTRADICADRKGVTWAPSSATSLGGRGTVTNLGVAR